MGRELLLIEPDRELAESVRRAFSPAGFDVTTLTTGEPAVDRCRASRPDLVLLAAELPDMSGFSVCNRIKRAVASVPLILYTADGSDAAVEAHRQTRTHADDYLRAPLDLAEVLRAATRLMEGTGAVQQEGAVGAPADGSATASVIDAPTATMAPPPIPRPLEAPTAPPPEPEELLTEWPRDPTPPRGGPEEKLEFFRERLRAKDAFLARVKEAMAAQREDAAELRSIVESLRKQLADAERARVEVERMLGEARSAAEALEAQRADAERRLSESDTTRQALSEVLSETMQQAESSEREWAQRLAAADDARAQVEASAAADRVAAAAALEAERDTRARAESEREEDRLAFEAQLTSVRDERDALGRELSRVHAQLDQQAALHEEQRAAAAAALAAAISERDEARARGEALSEALAEARVRAGALEEQMGQARLRADGLEQDLARERESRLVVAGQLERSLADVSAGSERLDAADRASRALEVELASARARIADLERNAADAQRARELELERLQRELGDAVALAAERARQGEDAARAAVEANAERERVQQQAASELQARASDITRIGADLTAAKRRISELETDRATREAQVARALSDAEGQRKALADATAEAEQRHAADVQRQKAALVDLERRLEASARAETQARRRIAELEKERAERAAQADRLAAVEEELTRTREELEDLKTENDFLNGEVARYNQKNRDLAAQLAAQKKG